MSNGIIYNQILCYNNSSITCRIIKKSFVEHNKLILILKDSQRLIIPGKNIYTTGHKKRIQELLLMTKDDVLKIREKSVKHYAKGKDDEYVLIKW